MWSRGGTSLILVLAPFCSTKHRRCREASPGCSTVPAAPISPGNPSNAAVLGWLFEQGRLWEAAGKCPVHREPFFVLLIFRGRFPTFTACLFYNRFDAGEDKLSRKGKTTNHLAALNRLFFFPPPLRGKISIPEAPVFLPGMSNISGGDTMIPAQSHQLGDTSEWQLKAQKLQHQPFQQP